MTKEEAQEAIDFISKSTGNRADTKMKNGIKHLLIIPKYENEERFYDIMDFLFFKILICNQKIDAMESRSERLLTVVSTKMNLVNFIENFKIQIDEFGTKPYDFDRVINRINASIDRARADLDIETLGLNNNLIAKQIELNDSQIETNEISKATNIYIAIFTFIAAEYYCYEFFRNYISDANPHKGTIINSCLFVLLALGIVAILQKYQQQRRIHKQHNS